MENEQYPIRRTSTLGGKLITKARHNSWIISSTYSARVSEPFDDDDLIRRFELFHERLRGVLVEDTPENRLRWLRSQIVGACAEFDSPFGKRRLTYADHTASGRCLQFIEDFILQDVVPFYGNSHTSDSFVGWQTTKTVHEAAQYVKKCLGGTDEDIILFCGSGATAAIKRLQEVMGITVPSIMRSKFLKCLQDEERWVVFVGPYEHHSNLLSWRQSLAEVVEIGLDEMGLIDIESLRLQLEFYGSKDRPMLGSFSACSNVSGIVSDTRAIARLLHQYEAFACFDFATSGPYVEIDMRSGEVDGYDAVFLSPHKFLGGPGSPGILLMTKSLYLLRSSPPSTCGGGTVEFVNSNYEEETLYYENIEEREDAGTPPIIQKIKSSLAFWVKQEYITIDVIQSIEHFYIRRALQMLLPNPKIWVLGNVTAKRQAVLSFVIFATPNSTSLKVEQEESKSRDKLLHGPYVAKLLNDLFGIQARGGCACAGTYAHSLFNVSHSQSLIRRSAVKSGYGGLRHGWTRVSFAYYMSNAEFEFIVAAIEFVAIYGQRFLPLYDFDWRTGAWSFKKHYEFFNDLPKSVGERKFPTSIPEYEKSNEQIEEESENADAVSHFASYLEAAKRIANMLPAHPYQRPLPKGVDPDLVYFRL